MCTLLYPDVIVASKVIDSFECVNSILQNIELAAEHVYITVDSCLACQENYKNMGVENVFTGTSERKWDKNDYVNYFNKLPHFFQKEGYDSPFYKVNISRIMEYSGESNSEEGVIRAIRKQLLTQSVYTPCTLRALGLGLLSEWQ